MHGLTFSFFVGILPTFGPSYINFYGSPRRYNIQNIEGEELNEGLGEGSAYRGRLLMQLTTTILDSESGGVSSVSREKLMRTGGVVRAYIRTPIPKVY
jgi:hypothetical protein